MTRSIMKVLCVAAFGWAMSAGPALAAPVSRFGSEGEGAGQISEEPRGIAVEQESGDVYVVDRNNNRVDKFGPEGEFLFAWGFGVANGANEAETCTTVCFAGLEGAGPGQFAFPEGVAVDNDPLSASFKDVYVVDARNHRLEKFDASGHFLLMVGGEVNETKDLTIGATEAEKNLCTAASGNVCKGGTEGSGHGQFEQSAGDVAVSPSGVVYVGDVNRVQKFNGAGVYQGQLTLAGSGDVTAVAVDPTNHIYVKSSELPGVRKYEASGAEVGEPRDISGEPSAIAIGPSSTLLVDDGLNSEGHHLLQYTASGSQIASFDAGTEGGSRGIAFGEAIKAVYVVNQGAVRLVSLPPTGPLVVAASEVATEIQPTSATLNAIVNPEGPEVTSYEFEYGPTAGYGSSTGSTELTGGPFEDQHAAAPVTGLQARTLYHFRVVVTNAAHETTFGPDETFTTLPPVSIDSTSASQVTSTSARLATELNPHGLATKYRFEYGLSTSYESAAPVPDASAGSSSGDVSFNLLVEGLVPGSTYHFRVVATNALGVVEGPDHTFTTQNSEAASLPDGRGWEMVSPPNKNGVSLESLTEEGGVIQAAEDGGAMTYVAKAPIDKEPEGNRSVLNTQIISARTGGVWSTEDIATPHETVAPFVPGQISEYWLFSSDLSLGAVEPAGVTLLSSEATEATPYLREVGAKRYRPLVTAANVAPGVHFGGTVESRGVHKEGVQFMTGTSDLQHIVLKSESALAGEAEDNGKESLYEWSGGKPASEQLRLVSILPNETPAAEEGASAALGGNNFELRNVISSDGNRIAFEALFESGHHLYLRDMIMKQTVQLDVPEKGLTTKSFFPSFQLASSDGSRVFFTDGGRLTANATATGTNPDLYMCQMVVVGGQLTCSLTDLTPDAHPGEHADVLGAVIGADEAGEHIYFAANGALAEGATSGTCPNINSGIPPASVLCNLYTYDVATGETKLVAVLSGRDFADFAAVGGQDLTGVASRVSPNGQYFAFMSQRSLTGYDNLDAHSGEPDQEVYLYNDATGGVRCVSCDPSGARPDGVFDAPVFPGLLVDRPRIWGGEWLAGSIPGWTRTNFGKSLYQSRYLSNSGRLFFDSASPLVPADANGKEDVYEYEPSGTGGCSTEVGCINLISSGTSGEETAFLDASVTGDDVFFLTTAKLVPSDVDNALDVYDAHVCTPAIPCPAATASEPPACTTADSCRTSPALQPELLGPPASATTSGSGNLPPAKPVVKAPTRAQKLAKALTACKRRPARKRAACRKRAKRLYGPVHPAKQKTKGRGK